MSKGTSSEVSAIARAAALGADREQGTRQGLEPHASRNHATEAAAAILDLILRHTLRLGG